MCNRARLSIEPETLRTRFSADWLAKRRMDIRASVALRWRAVTEVSAWSGAGSRSLESIDFHQLITDLAEDSRFRGWVVKLLMFLAVACMAVHPPTALVPALQEHAARSAGRARRAVIAAFLSITPAARAAVARAMDS